jgi:hypothetical protein
MSGHELSDGGIFGSNNTFLAAVLIELSAAEEGVGAIGEEPS